MSSALSIEIQGTRSFGGDKQTIQFSSNPPLTLILGPNGSGKTTIIECLKYIATGELPPGAQRSAAAFVHDPRIARDNQVVSEIRFTFLDVNSKPCTAIRKISATSVNGMVYLLGVSPTILNDVIFCHQEDSNWPLSEGSVLKTKFDVIFESTRYVEALKKLKVCKQNSTAMAILKEKIKSLKIQKKEAEKIQKNKDTKEEQLGSSLVLVSKYETEIVSMSEQLRMFDIGNGDYNRKKKNAETLRDKIKQLQQNQSELQNKIKNKFGGSDAELCEKLKNFDEKKSERKTHMKQLDEKQRTTQSDEGQLESEKDSLLLKLGKLEQEAQTYSETVKKKQAFVNELADEFGQAEYSDSKTDPEVLGWLDQKIISVESESKTRKSDLDSQSDDIQRNIDQQTTKKTQLETEQSMNSHSLTSDLEATEGGVDVNGLNAEIYDLEKKKTTLDKKIKRLEVEMDRLTCATEVLTQLKSFRDEKITKEEHIKDIRQRLEKPMKSIVGHIPEDNMKEALDASISRLKEEADENRDVLIKKKTKRTEKQTEKSINEKILTECHDNLKDYDDRIQEVSSSGNFIEELTRLQEELTLAQEEEGQLSGKENVYTTYRNQLNADQTCPLCHQNFDNMKDKFDSLMAEIRDQLQSVPEKRKNLQAEIRNKHKRVERLQQLQPTYDAISKLNSQMIKLQSENTVLVHEIASFNSEITEDENTLKSALDDVSNRSKLQTDAGNADRLQGEGLELDDKINLIKNSSSKATIQDTDRSLQDVISERNKIQRQIEAVDDDIKGKNETISQHDKLLQSLQKQDIHLKNEKWQAEKNLQQRSTLEGKRDELEDKNRALEKEIRKTKEQLQPLQRNIDHLKGAKQKLNKEIEAMSHKEKKKISQLQEKRKTLTSYNIDIESYVNGGKQENLEEEYEKKRKIEKHISSLDRKVQEISRSIVENKEDIDKHETQKRDLDDTLLVRKKQVEIDEENISINALKMEIDGVDHIQLLHDWDVLRKEKEKREGEKNKENGRQEELKKEVEKLSTELEKDYYKNAQQNYMDKIFELKTTEVANADLQKYYGALNYCILDYHRSKMEEINNTIRDLWRDTYTGHDIETIQIKSEDGEHDKTRRVYNYRVVMTVGGVELDMRGRCSAGQKVLASLIIRLALAESFCINCGIMTLDEPTTNLDRENVDRLVYALDEIIKSRSRQRNFQLIVITHDEGFVERFRLGRSEYLEEFYEVKKNENGCSQLSKTHINNFNPR